MQDEFDDHSAGITSPASRAETITPSDTSALDFVTRAIYVGQSGNLTLRLKSGQTAVFQNVHAGSVYALRATHVLASGTTATGLVGLS